MADFTIAEVKEDLNGILHSTSTAKVINLNALLYRAARNVLTKVDPPSTIRIAQITNAVHDDIYDYAAPSDLKGSKIIDIRPQVKRTEADSFSQRGIKDFAKYLADGEFSIREDSGNKTLRIAVDISPSPVTLNEMDSLTANGTWAAADSGNNLTLDTLDYVLGSGCLNFDATGATVSVSIQVSDMTAVDLSTHDEKSQLFVWVYIPDKSIVSSVTLLWGNDLTTNYWSATATTPHDATAIKTGWNLFRFNWNGATETGTVAPATIDSLKITITQSAATVETDYRVDRIVSTVGKIYEIEYYSEFLFRSSAGTFQQKTSDNSDIINLDEDGYNLYINECGFLIAQQVKGANGVSDLNFFREELYGTGFQKQGLYEKFKTDHPSQAIRMISSYYKIGLYRRN